eukprot:scaffold1764_cov139-Isochrysis_galbana.AAC.5
MVDDRWLNERLAMCRCIDKLKMYHEIVCAYHAPEPHTLDYNCITPTGLPRPSRSPRRPGTRSARRSACPCGVRRAVPPPTVRRASHQNPSPLPRRGSRPAPNIGSGRAGGVCVGTGCGGTTTIIEGLLWSGKGRVNTAL